MMIKFFLPIPRLMTIFTLIVVMLGTSAVMSSDSEVNMDGVLMLAGRHNLGHACPLDENYALTAAHVIDIRPFDKGQPLYPFRYETLSGDIGIAVGGLAYASADIGWMKLSSPVSIVYPMAKSAPKREDKVFWLEYEMDDKKKAFESKRKEAKVLRSFSGQVVFDEAPEGGASGGCLFNESGEVVGIVSSAWAIGSFSTRHTTGMATGVWGEWALEIPNDKNQ
jgi:hypothetical protein